MLKQLKGDGRILIPRDIMKEFGMPQGGYLDVSIDGDAIILKKQKRPDVIDFRRTTVINIDASEVSKRKREFKKGDRVRLLNMESDQFLIPQDSEGTVTNVDDIGSVHVKWDDGREIAVLTIPGDTLEKI